MRDGGKGERFWDGESWTGQARGLVFDVPSQQSKVAPAPAPAPAPFPSQSPVPALVSPQPSATEPGASRGIIIAVVVAAVVALLVVIVGVAVATTPHRIAVPSVLESTETDAVSAIRELGLQVVVTYSHDALPAGRVIKVTPTAGTKLDVGESTHLVVSLGPDNPVPTTEEKAACSYVRGLGEALQATASSDRVAFAQRTAGDLISHASAVKRNKSLSSALDSFVTDWARTADFLKAHVQPSTEFATQVVKDQEVVLASCEDLGL